jgi:hypothetical protein
MPKEKRPIRLRVFVSLLVVVPVALGMKYYSGPLRWWLNNWGSSFGYEIFFMLIAMFILPRRGAITIIAVCVCLVTCGLEFLQLWKPPLLEWARSTFVGRGLLGNMFSWWDLPAYPLGCLLGWFLLRRITRSGTEENSLSNSFAPSSNLRRGS